MQTTLIDTKGIAAFEAQAPTLGLSIDRNPEGQFVEYTTRVAFALWCKAWGAQQSRIDELMFEYCSTEMTAEQIQIYARSQQVSQDTSTISKLLPHKLNPKLPVETVKPQLRGESIAFLGVDAYAASFMFEPSTNKAHVEPPETATDSSVTIACNTSRAPGVVCTVVPEVVMPTDPNNIWADNVNPEHSGD